MTLILCVYLPILAAKQMGKVHNELAFITCFKSFYK